jgi:NOL1/NOP2/fmu family ribosome biogenesis protein
MFLEQLVRSCELPAEGARVLDLCGAPGGKSTHLAQLIGPRNLLVSNEVIRSRAAILSENLSKWGSPNVLVTQSDPSAFTELEGFFDLVVVDAPCSGEGMFRSEAVRGEWSPAVTSLCSERQKRILQDVWPSLKRGGFLIYSTCTFNPAENEENIRWLCDTQETGAAGIDTLQFPGITTIDAGGVACHAFHPGKTLGEGFFAAVVRKTGGCERAEISIGRIKNKGIRIAEAGSLMRIADTEPERLIEAGRSFYSIPCSAGIYAYLSRSLNIIKPGVELGSFKNADLIPAHDLAMSVILKQGAFAEAEVSLSDAVSYLRLGSLSARLPERGWNVLTWKSVRLGFVNNIGSRTNNYYPRGWRVRMEVTSPEDIDIIKWDEEGS